MPTKIEFAEILGMLAVAFPKFTLKEETISVYSKLLYDIDADELRTAAIECTSRCDFFPSVHELRNIVIDLRCKANKIPTAYEAWEDLRRAGDGCIYKTGLNPDNTMWYEKREYQFSHPIVKRVAEMLGWPRDFPGADGISYERTTFIKAYNETLQTLIGREMMLPEVRESIEKNKISGMIGAGEHGQLRKVNQNG
jgi:hypothetical protein